MRALERSSGWAASDFGGGKKLLRIARESYICIKLAPGSGHSSLHKHTLYSPALHPDS
jgi:hypothetical protein